MKALRYEETMYKESNEEYIMKIVEPFNAKIGKFNSLFGCNNAIFLAGPCPRENFDEDWRQKAIEILFDIGFNGTILTPTNPYFKVMESKFGFTSETARSAQVAWERAAMHIASAIVFWVPRSEKFPARTTNYEFGEWYKKPNVFVGWPDGSIHNEYMECKLQEQNKTHYISLETILNAAVESLSRSGTMFFTSDTHFSQQRTLELSRRPFVDITEMNYEIMSNWNKNVTMNDVVVHAGDFIDPDKIDIMLKPILSLLNFRELHWVLGNYDRKAIDNIQNVVSSLDRPIVIHDTNFKFIDEDVSYVVVHEPNDFEIDATENDIILFGHIHGRSFAKRNGFDIGCDYHQYTPVSLEQVKWFTNAMKYWDENVYADKANIAG